MTYYVAGRISDCPNYKNNFQWAYNHIKEIDKDCKVILPSVLPQDLDYEKCMQICFKMIDVSDAIVFMDDWTLSQGAIREYYYGRATGKILLDINLKELRNKEV